MNVKHDIGIKPIQQQQQQNQQQKPACRLPENVDVRASLKSLAGTNHKENLVHTKSTIWPYLPPMPIKNSDSKNRCNEVDRIVSSSCNMRKVMLSSNERKTQNFKHVEKQNLNQSATDSPSSSKLHKNIHVPQLPIMWQR